MTCSMTRELAAAVALLLTALVACDSIGNGSAGSEEVAHLLFVNASPRAGTMDVLVNDQMALSGVAFGESRERLVPPISLTVSVVATGGAGGTASLPVTFGVDAHHTLLAAGEVDSLDLLFAADTGRVPAPGTAKFRVIHAAPNAPPIDVYLTQSGADLGSAIRLVFPFTYGTGSSDVFPGYVQRDPGTYQVRFTAEGTANVLVDTGSITVAAGQVRTVILLDDASGGLDFTIVAEEP